MENEGIDNLASASQIADIIRAASEHNVDLLEACLRKYSFVECEAADVLDPVTGYSPLHAAIASCKGTSDNKEVYAHDGTAETGDTEELARKTIHSLLENGAIWNQLDVNNETPGCIAYRLGCTSLYQLMVDAGVRAEMLLNRLDEYEQLEDDELEGEENTIVDGQEGNANEAESDHISATVHGENEQLTSPTGNGAAPDVNSTAYLSSTLSMSDNKLLDNERNGVMMAWESGIMSQSADALLPEAELKVLNIGFGMGIIDSHLQSHKNKPASHHIVEAHPDVLKDMNHKGWQNLPGVVVHAGKWQDVLPQLVAENETFDAIYFDTFAESYTQFRDFFSENAIGLLSQTGKWSFFNGMGADRQISYDVYQKVVELDLFESGFDVEWSDVELPKLDLEWEGVRRKYWNIERYRLPVCRFMD